MANRVTECNSHPQYSHHHQMHKRDSNLMDINIWKHYLYELQQSAPTPKRIVCRYETPKRPPQYGREFHGVLSREQSDALLTEESEDGRYLVRESARNRGQMTLSLRFNTVTKNFRLYYDGKHYVGDKRFDTIHDLVADGLITLYLEAHAADYIASLGNACKYEESPYMTLNKKHNQKKKPKRSNKKSLEAKRISNYNDIPDVEDSSETDASSIDVKLFEKAHVFKTHNFMGLPWCDFCGNFMWGIMAQGVKCEDCGFGAHRKCSEKVPNDCSPDLRHIRRIFGVDLTTFVKACNNIRPFVIDICVKEIEKRGLGIEGLYRVSGFADDVEALRIKFESEWENVESHLKNCEDIHVITGVLKLYFRLLPIPVITFDSYPQFMAAIKKSSPDARISSLKESITKLPPAHYQTLKFFMAHLNKVASFEEKNLMSAHNLSTIFCPTLMRTPNIGLMPFQSCCWQNECDILETMIVHHSKLFHK